MLLLKPKDEAFAILPNYGENNDEKSFSANISKKTIYQKRIDVNDVLKKIRKGDPDLENIVEKLLEINI